MVTDRCFFLTWIVVLCIALPKARFLEYTGLSAVVQNVEMSNIPGSLHESFLGEISKISHTKAQGIHNSCLVKFSHAKAQ